MISSVQIGNRLLVKLAIPEPEREIRRKERRRPQSSLMEAFEHVVKVFLETQGYAVTSNVKFPVRKKVRKAAREEFQTHGYEVDIVAARSDCLLLGSVKSFLGSKGLSRQAFDGIADSQRKTHLDQCKLFNDPVVKDGVLKEAAKRYGYPMKAISMAMFVGKFAGNDEDYIRRHLGKMRVGGKPVRVYGLAEIIIGVVKASEAKTYVDDPVIVTVKCLNSLNLLRRSPDRHGNE